MSEGICMVEGCEKPVERVWGITVFLVEVGKAPLCEHHGELLMRHMSVRDAMGATSVDDVSHGGAE